MDSLAPQDIIAWAVRTFGGRVAAACSFGGATGMVLLDMLVQIDKRIPVYYLDTGLLFPQTYEHIARVSKHYGIEPIRVRTQLTLEAQADAYGPELWARDPDLCCNLRKVEPQREFLRDYDAWMSGIRRDHSENRRGVPVVSRDEKFGVVKVSPLATWTESMVWTYIKAHDVPYNPLHDDGYRSIGCTTCTLRARADEDARAGRWHGFAKTECGLHA